jgi:hypothetical protein
MSVIISRGMRHDNMTWPAMSRCNIQHAMSCCFTIHMLCHNISCRHNTTCHITTCCATTPHDVFTTPHVCCVTMPHVWCHPHVCCDATTHPHVCCDPHVCCVTAPHVCCVTTPHVCCVTTPHVYSTTCHVNISHHVVTLTWHGVTVICHVATVIDYMLYYDMSCCLWHVMLLPCCACIMSCWWHVMLWLSVMLWHDVVGHVMGHHLPNWVRSVLMSASYNKVSSWCCGLYWSQGHQAQGHQLV